MTKQGNLKKIVMPRPAHGFVTYLMEYAFTLRQGNSRRPAYGALSVTALIRPFDL